MPDTLEPSASAGRSVPISPQNALRAIRETKGYSMEELSLTCGLATFELADIENGKDVDPVKLRRIAAALRLPEDVLIVEH
jgi:transcriptional regulator with XRE-family HTH domain